ncbi:monovalent cation/H(+) antiporter subunit G [Roseovarius faecimaris]|uniref:Monovalent cation/H(+) antiporter subunit G n=1 Tax=Roseovarius faecimaris TaxID=2494550 RepID=A0A6I6IVL7_9RHOB|nr:monovalent cation/H(+) antiporter subunit G [Roseovarius faecimaris]QGX99681.1 monovalent cation/H(+) antiporter subunit G [Roseovarius faecimaris]
MSLQIIGTYAAALSLLVGSGFILVGVIGLLKFNDPMTRLHAPTKVGTLGIGMLLLAGMIHSFLLGDTSIHEMLIMAFLFVTAPISAHFIAKVSIHQRSCQTPPPPTNDSTWSTLSAPDKGDQA